MTAASRAWRVDKEARMDARVEASKTEGPVDSSPPVWPLCRLAGGIDGGSALVWDGGAPGPLIRSRWHRYKAIYSED